MILTYTHPYPCPRMIACTDSYFSFMFTEAFPLHACGVTCNLHTYFASVRRVFLVETAVLQTVPWDIRAWSARFLVHTWSLWDILLADPCERGRSGHVRGLMFPLPYLAAVCDWRHFIWHLMSTRSWHSIEPSEWTLYQRFPRIWCNKHLRI